MIITPEYAQWTWFQYVHFVCPIQFHFANIIAQIVWIRYDNLILWTMLQSCGALCQIDAAQCPSIGINGRRHIALHPSFGLTRFRQLNCKSVVTFCTDAWKVQAQMKWNESEFGTPMCVRDAHLYLRQNGYSFPVARKYLPGATDTPLPLPPSTWSPRSDGITSFSDELNDWIFGNVAW